MIDKEKIKKARNESLEITLYCINRGIKPIDREALKYVNNMLVFNPDKSLEDFFPQKTTAKMLMNIIYAITYWQKDSRNIAKANYKLNNSPEYREIIQERLDNEIRPYLNSKVIQNPESDFFKKIF